MNLSTGPKAVDDAPAEDGSLIGFPVRPSASVTSTYDQVWTRRPQWLDDPDPVDPGLISKGLSLFPELSSAGPRRAPQPVVNQMKKKGNTLDEILVID